MNSRHGRLGLTLASLLTGLLTGLLASTARLSAQIGTGDAVFGGTPFTSIARDGTFTSLAPLPAGAEMTALMQAPDNQGFLVAVTTFPGKPFLGLYDHTGVTTTLMQSHALPTPWELLLDSRGRVVVVGTTTFGQTGFAEFVNGVFDLKYEAALDHPTNAAPIRACLDPLTDQVLTLTPTGELILLEREDPITPTTIAASSSFAFPGGIHEHPHADKVIVEGLAGDFLIVDRFSGARTTLHTAPSTVTSVVDWDVDPYLNAVVVLRRESGGNNVLMRIDLDTGATTVVRSSSTSGPQNRRMALHGTRILAYNSGDAKIGETYEMRVSFPGNPGDDYVVAASVDAHPGFTLLSRHIPLKLDPLISQSLSTPSVYEGFIGKLDQAGEAFPRFHVQSDMAGKRFYFAAVLVENGLITAVSLPFGVTVENNTP